MSNPIQSRNKDFLQPLFIESYYLLNVYYFHSTGNLVYLKSGNEHSNRVKGKENKKVLFFSFVPSSSLRI